MKKILFSLLTVLAVCLISCEKEKYDPSMDEIIQFEDTNFFLALLKIRTTLGFIKVMDVDTNRDGQISIYEAQNAEGLNVSESYISAMPEIKYFTSLVNLTCYSNQLASLDVSNNPALKELYCSDNQLISLNVGNNSALSYLYCYDNQLTSLDLSNVPKLYHLYCSNNQLTSLDLSNNLDLVYLACSNNRLTKVILNKNHALESMYIQWIIGEYGNIIEYVD